MFSYVLVAVRHPVYRMALCATSRRNPLYDDLAAIEMTLAAQGFQGLLLCDLWLAVGSTASRFLVGEFTGRHFTVWTADAASSTHSDLVAQFTALYQRHPRWVRSSRLSWSARRTLFQTSVSVAAEAPSVYS